MRRPTIDPMITVDCGNFPVEVARDDLETAMLVLLDGDGPLFQITPRLRAAGITPGPHMASIIVAARTAIARGVEPYPATTR